MQGLSKPEPVTAVIVHRDGMGREGLRLQLERIPGVTVIGEASNGTDATLRVADLTPRLAFIDIRLPQRNGIDVAAEIHRRHPAIGLIMLTASLEPENVVRSLKAGARGYVFKEGPPEELKLAVNAALNGHFFVSPAVAGELLTNYVGGVPLRLSGLDRLTAREREVLQRIAEGATNKDDREQPEVVVENG